MIKQVTFFTLLLILLIGCGELGFGVEESTPEQSTEPAVVTVVVVATPTPDSAETIPPTPSATEPPKPTATNVVEESSELPTDADIPSDTITVDCEPRSDTDFSGQTQSRPNYRVAELRCANFDNTTLAQPDFDQSDLSGATFVGARLSQPDCNGSKMIGVDFSGAVLAQGDFVNCDLTGADLRTATLSNIDWVNTICPNGVNSDEQGNTCASESAMSPISIFVNGVVLFSDTVVGTVTGGSVEVDVEVAEPALAPEWRIDSDGNAIPDFIEIEIGYDPTIDDCIPSACLLASTDAVDAPQPTYQDENVLVILDASGSMGDPMGDTTRIEAAKETLIDYVELLPSTVKLGFMVYGHKGDPTEEGKPASCDGVELLGEVGEVSAEMFPTVLSSFQPNGWTPIGSALQQAERAFADHIGARNKIILVTDGLETCGQDPIAIATQLRANPNIELIVDVIGFGIVSADERLQLEQLAKAGGGIYHDVQRITDFQDYVQSLNAQALAQLQYAACMGREALAASACYTTLHIGTGAIISTHRLSLSADFNNDHDAEIAELDAISDAITAHAELRETRFEAWQAEQSVILDEFTRLSNEAATTFNGNVTIDADGVTVGGDDEVVVDADGVTVGGDDGVSVGGVNVGPGGVSVGSSDDADDPQDPPDPDDAPDQSNTACSPGTGANYAGELIITANFSNEDLRNANFNNATVANANFTGAMLTCATFDSAELANGNFNRVSAAGVRFTSAVLGNATFNGAYLENASFAGAELGNNVFTNANLQGADFSGAVWGLLTFNNTICPDGTNSDSNGGSCALR